MLPSVRYLAFAPLAAQRIGAGRGGHGRICSIRHCEGDFMNPQDLHAHAARASAVLKAMGNERRLRVLCHISESERSVGELERLVGLSQSALSQHLARLRRDGLVRTRREAQTVFYSLSGAEVSAVMRSLHDLYCRDMLATEGPVARNGAEVRL